MSKKYEIGKCPHCDHVVLSGKSLLHGNGPWTLECEKCTGKWDVNVDNGIFTASNFVIEAKKEKRSKRIQTIRLTSEMLLDLMRGKDLWLHCVDHNDDGEMVESQIRFKGPFDGMYLTHEEIQNMQEATEARMMRSFSNVIEAHIARYEVKPEN